MKTSIFRIVLLCIFIIIGLTAQSWGAGSTAIMPSVGDGSSGSPYQIASLGNLYWIAALGEVDGLTLDVRLSKYYIQTADIDASATQYWDDADGNSDGDLYNDPDDLTSTGSNQGWFPIGNSTYKFTGSYDGQNHTISGIYVNRSINNIGLFGVSDLAITIKNVGVININITGLDDVGGLVGWIKKPITITDCYATGSINGEECIGGLIGAATGTSSSVLVEISGCHAAVATTGQYEVGGLIGYANYCTISNSYATGNVICETTGDTDVGGLVGLSWYGYLTITNCYATGSVTNAGENTGGLFGFIYSNSLTVANSYASGNVTGTNYVGGLMGNVSTHTVTNSYATGNVSGTSFLGGLAGILDGGTVSNSYSRGSVSGTNQYIGGFAGEVFTNELTNCYSTGAVSGSSGVGGFIGYADNYNTYTANFWDTQTSGTTDGVGSIDDPAGVTGKTTTQMTTTSTFTDAGWDFTVNGEDDDWRISSVNDSYPHLVWAESVDTSLPVELSVFTAECQNTGVLLKWSTESEIENLGFIIERKSVGANHDLPASWSQIAGYQTNPALEGHGTTTVKHNYQYTDNAVQPGMTYTYRLGDVDYDGTLTWHKTVTITTKAGETQVAATFGLHKAYPNPFNPSVTLSYTLTDNNLTTLQVYNMRGQLVEMLVNAQQVAGVYELIWQPENLSNGVYIVRLQSGYKTNLQKIMFVK